MTLKDRTLSPGSVVLVTGATGFVASHIVGCLLEKGFKVRGTVRNLASASWLNNLFGDASRNGDLELVTVSDFAAEHAFDDAVKGVSAIAHVATIATFDPDPNQVILPVIAGITNILNAAEKESSVLEFVYTGSLLAATFPTLGNYTHVVPDTWNNSAAQMAWAPPPYTHDRSFPVYAASKMAVEKRLWDIVKNRRLGFNVNCVSPSIILGEPLHPRHNEGAGSWVRKIWNNYRASLNSIPAALFVDVSDIAALHVAVMLDPDVKNSRLQAWGHHGNWNDIIMILRKLQPKRKFMPLFDSYSHLSITTDQSAGVELLRKWTGRTGFRSIEDMIAKNIGSRAFLNRDPTQISVSRAAVRRQSAKLQDVLTGKLQSPQKAKVGKRTATPRRLRQKQTAAVASYLVDLV